MPDFSVEARSVVFITTPDGAGELVPAGTAFFTRMTDDHRSWFTYLVTAAHVVRSTQDESFMRVALDPQSFHEPADTEDIRIPKWFFHEDPGIDVAVAPVSLDKQRHSFGSLSAPRPTHEETQGVNRRSGITPGEAVYYIGLLGNVPEMGRRNVPMVRSGTLGAVWQEMVPVRIDEHTELATTAHLIDAHSHGGFSGSPCFSYTPRLQGERSVGHVREVTDEAFRRRDIVEFMGMIRGHFPHSERALVSDGEGEVWETRVPVNAGVAVVTPASFIGDVLAYDDLVADRKARKVARTAAMVDQDAAVEDSSEP